MRECETHFEHNFILESSNSPVTCIFSACASLLSPLFSFLTVILQAASNIGLIQMRPSYHPEGLYDDEKKVTTWSKETPNPMTEHAIAYVEGDKYYGAKATINVWEPKIQQPNEFSLSHIWVLGGSFGEDLNSIEAGWQLELLRTPSEVRVAHQSAPLAGAVIHYSATEPISAIIGSESTSRVHNTLSHQRVTSHVRERIREITRSVSRMNLLIAIIQICPIRDLDEDSRQELNQLCLEYNLLHSLLEITNRQEHNLTSIDALLVAIQHTGELFTSLVRLDLGKTRLVKELAAADKGIEALPDKTFVRHCNVSLFYDRCDQGVIEDVRHTLFECPRAQEVGVPVPQPPQAVIYQRFPTNYNTSD
ncbi:hypothetical protein LguiA_018130 [Lonicera macranthoides]